MKKFRKTQLDAQVRPPNEILAFRRRMQENIEFENNPDNIEVLS